MRITDTIETNGNVIHLGTGIFDNGDGTVDMIRLAVTTNGVRRDHAASLITIPKSEILAMTKG